INTTEAGIADEVEEPINGLEVEQSMADALGLLREANVEQSQPHVTLPVLPDTSNSYVMEDENLEVSAVTNIQALDEQQEESPKERILDSSNPNAMNVIVVAAECGLGDVVGELPKALARRGHRVMVFDPYGNYAEPKGVGVLKKVQGLGGYILSQAYIDCVDFDFIDSQTFTKMHRFYYHDPLASIINSAKMNYSFLLFQVPLHVPCGVRCGDGNLGFIANDWHTSLLPVYSKASYRDIGLMKYAPSLFVIHSSS
ncbi:unnamed protein product, partial [Musa hybrid cultivar]